MEQKNIHWLTVFIVAVFAVCGGFVAGSLLGVRERGLLKVRNSALVQSEVQTLERLSEAEVRTDEISMQLDQARDDAALWRTECERLETLVTRRSDAVSDFHPPMVMDLDSLETLSRIIELECEVASLKELVNNAPGPMEGPPSNPPRPGLTLAKVVEPSAEKEQCSAITKKGIRCSRPSRSNGKCWQHGG